MVALVGALGGAATALPGGNTVDSGDIRPNSVKSSDIANNTITGADVREARLALMPRVPPRQTIRGVFGTAGTTVQREFVSFPVPAPSDLNDANVNFAPGQKARDDDPACTGSPESPTAPPGKVCLYADAFWAGTDDASCTGESSAPDFSPEGNFRFGFRVEATGAGPTTGCIGTWAYTAPRQLSG